MIRLGIGEWVVTSEVREVLVANGLGSCVAVVFFDPATKLGGMAHAMLPRGPASHSRLNGNENPGKFVDTAIDTLAAKFEEKKVPIHRIKAYLVGGASMFSSIPAGDGPGIGQQNIAMAREKLREKRISLAGEDTGKDFGRTVEFRLDNAELRVSSMKFEVKRF